MHPGLLRRSTRAQLTTILVVVLLLRSLIPPGFMPGSGGGLILCPDGLPVLSVHAEHHHHGGGGSPTHIEHCPFGGLACGPTAHSCPAVAMAAPESRPVFHYASSLWGAQRIPLPPARAPPSFA